MFRDVLVFHDKIDLVTAAGFTVRAKTGPGVGLRIYLQAGGFVIVEGAFQAMVAIGCKVVMVKNPDQFKAGFDFRDFYAKIF